MSTQHLGRMSDTVRDLSRHTPPAYVEVRVMLPAGLVKALEEHVVNRVHDGELPPHGLELERDAHMALAIRYMIDHWPDLGPPYTPPQDAEPRGAAA